MMVQRIANGTMEMRSKASRIPYTQGVLTWMFSFAGVTKYGLLVAVMLVVSLLSSLLSAAVLLLVFFVFVSMPVGAVIGVNGRDAMLLFVQCLWFWGGSVAVLWCVFHYFF